MESPAKHLRVLGLPDEASLEDATAAYRDLVRVWHPDRFPGDARLRRKAEEQTRLLNQAISFLRKALTEPRPPPLRPAARTVKPTKPTQTRHFKSTFKSPSSTFPSLAIHQTRRGSCYQIGSGAAIMVMGVALLTRLEQVTPAQTALGIVMAACGVSSFMMGLTLLCFATPAITVNNIQLQALGIPNIPLDFINNIWVTNNSTGVYLTVRVVKEYFQKLPFNLRWYFALRYYTRRPHLRIRCNHLDIHPNHIVNTIKLAYESDAVVAADLSALKRFKIPWNALASLCVLVAMLRCFVEHIGAPFHYLPYLAIFVALRGCAIFQSLREARSR